MTERMDTTMLQKIVLISLGGAFGALCRFGLAGLIQRNLDSVFPWGTAIVNLSGCLLFGILWALAVERSSLSPEFRSFVFVGFLGSFTTFSTFISETGQLMTNSEPMTGLANAAIQLIAGTGLFFLGLAAGRIV